jgi:hypothetical protein
LSNQMGRISSTPPTDPVTPLCCGLAIHNAGPAALTGDHALPIVSNSNANDRVTSDWNGAERRVPVIRALEQDIESSIVRVPANRRRT